MRRLFFRLVLCSQAIVYAFGIFIDEITHRMKDKANTRRRLNLIARRIYKIKLKVLRLRKDKGNGD